MSAKRDGTFLEFIVRDDLQGRELTESLRRKGIHIERPYSDGNDPDLNNQFVVARLPRRLAHRFTERIVGHPGTDIFIGVYQPLKAPLAPPAFAELDFHGGVGKPLSSS